MALALFLALVALVAGPAAALVAWWALALVPVMVERYRRAVTMEV